MTLCGSRGECVLPRDPLILRRNARAGSHGFFDCKYNNDYNNY